LGHEGKLTLDVMLVLPFRTVALALAATLIFTLVALERRHLSKEKLANRHDIVIVDSGARAALLPATPKPHRT